MHLLGLFLLVIDILLPLHHIRSLQTCKYDQSLVPWKPTHTHNNFMSIKAPCMLCVESEGE